MGIRRIKLTKKQAELRGHDKQFLKECRYVGLVIYTDKDAYNRLLFKKQNEKPYANLIIPKDFDYLEEFEFVIK